jgi:hypothetical protein
MVFRGWMDGWEESTRKEVWGKEREGVNVRGRWVRECMMALNISFVRQCYEEEKHAGIAMLTTSKADIDCQQKV